MAGGTEFRYVLQLAYAHSQNTPPRCVNAGKDLFLFLFFLSLLSLFWESVVAKILRWPHDFHPLVYKPCIILKNVGNLLTC